MKEQHSTIAQDAATDRMKRAYERLQSAWRAIHARRAANCKRQLDEAAIIELDAAEDEWLEARSAALPANQGERAINSMQP